MNNTANSIDAAHVMLIDTQREKDIYLGTGYPFATQSSGECLITNYDAGLLDVQVNQSVSLFINATFTITAIMENYNLLSAANGWKPLENTTFNFTTEMPCSVSGLMDGTYQKYHDDDYAESTIIMEYEPFLQYLSLYLPDDRTNADFLQFIQTNSDFMFDFADYMPYTLPHPRYAFYQYQDF